MVAVKLIIYGDSLLDSSTIGSACKLFAAEPKRNVCSLEGGHSIG